MGGTDAGRAQDASKHPKRLHFGPSYKRLERGTFQLPALTGSEGKVQVDGSTFASLLAGIDFTAARRGWYRRDRTALRGGSTAIA